MNVLFFDPTYLAENSWPYILKVLKVKSVFSFIPREELPSSCKDTPNDISMSLISESDDCSSFAKKVVYSITNKCKKYIPEIAGFVDIDSFKDSKWSTPRNNISKTDDPNIIVLGRIIFSYNKGTYFVDNVNDKEDVKLYIASFSLNILKKQFGHDNYRSRICFSEYEILGQTYKLYTGRVFRDMKVLIKTAFNLQKHTILGYINYALKRDFNDIFPTVEINGKKCCTPFWDVNNVAKAREDRSAYIARCIEEENRKREENNSWYDWEEEKEQMNREFWDEMGDSGVNLM